MSQHLRALLYDPTHGSENELVDNVMSAFASSVAVCIISTTQPKYLVEKSIIAVDPSEVLDLSSGQITSRKLAIVETNDLAAVVLTSGTTHSPKPVELTYSGMTTSAQALYKYCELSSSDKWLCVLPPNYIAGLAIFARCFTQNSSLIVSSSFNPEDFEKTILENNVTVTSLVPKQLRDLIQSNINFGSLNKIILGGTKIDIDLLEVARSYGIKIFSSYGLTETWGGICMDGNFLDGTQGRISNDGHLELKTKSIMAGYRHNQPLTNSKFTSTGWFKTGDIGIIENNRLSISGRADELINSAGIKIDPAQLEVIISQHLPELEFAICSTEHEILGESVTICVETNLAKLISLGSLRSELRELLASTQLPTRLASIDSIPKTDSGKVQRKILSARCKIIEDHLGTLDAR